MSSPTHRANLEAQMRKKYMRMKTINNHETVKLSKALDGLHKYTVTSLEHHLQDNQEISALWNRCSTTTGWFEGAVKPCRRDVRNIMDTELRAKTTPWAYSTSGTIEMWDKYPPMRRPIRRPKTALGTYSIKTTSEGNDRLKRPMTVTGTRNESPSHTLTSELIDSDSSIRLRAKSARVHINTQTFHSPRLDDKYVKANARPITAGPLLGGRKANMLKEKYGRQGEKAMARPVKSAIQPRNRGDSFVDDVFMDSVDGPPQKHVTKVEIIRKSDAENQQTRPTSVRFTRMSSSLSLNKRLSNIAGSEVSRSDRGSSKYQHDDSSDDEDSRIKNKENKAQLPKWNMPKFYVKPQDRYKMDDMFLMRRFTLLQRQLNAEVPPEVIEGNDKLQMNVLFSSMARKSKLKHLTEENSQKLKTDQKRTYRDTGLKQRLDRFMNEIDKYIESQKEEQ